jgi:HD-like signal output (HDOD) protein
MGKIAIDACFAGKFVTVFDETFSEDVSMLETEREILGETHEKFGGMLAQKWNLPTSLCDAVAYHHELPSMKSFAALENPRIVAISYLAEAFCQHYEIGWDGDSIECDLENARVWELLLKEQDVYTSRDIDIITTETMQVFKEARPHLLWE